MFTTILVGLDGSERQENVLRQAVELADRCGGKLHLARAMQVPADMPVSVWAMRGDDFDKFLLEQGQAALERLEKMVPPGLMAHRWVEMGKPAEVLCRLATETRADLVVIGSHGYDRLEQIIGTTAAKVVNKAPCTVVVVR